MKLGLLFETHQTLQDSLDLTEIRSKPTPLLEQEIRDILVSMGQTVQEFDFDVEVWSKLYVLLMALLQTTLVRLHEIDNNKVKMIISMLV